MMRPLRTALIVLAVATSQIGCRAATPSPTTVPPSEAQPQTASSAASLPNDLHWIRNSAEYQAILWQVYRMAGEVLVAMAADLEPGTWAVALDADETLINNSLYEKEQVALGLGYDPDTWKAWVARKEAEPLSPALGFLARVRELGGKIAVVTNRRHDECPDTEANFRSVSIPFDVMLCRKDEPRKEPRWRQIEEGTAAKDLPPLKIVMWLGDNIKDFPELDQDLRHQSGTAFERFGLEYFVLPNPMYGSWEDNPPN